ncbi:MAG: hypothetical protein FWD13_09545 [Treponema sp.]|nr:hypothetical protein [Treponema sp.]
MELMYLSLILPFFIFWCVNEKVGLQLGIVGLLSIWTIVLFKHLDIEFPINIEIGWIIVAVIFCSYLLLGKKIEWFIKLGGFRAFMLTSAVIAFLMIIYRPSLEFVLPGGMFLGMGAGYCLNKRYVGFKSTNVLHKKGLVKYLTLVARFILGMAVLVLIILRVDPIIQIVSESQNVHLYGFLCYAIIGLWVFFAAPWLFIRLRLSVSEITGSETAVSEVTVNETTGSETTESKNTEDNNPEDTGNEDVS